MTLHYVDDFAAVCLAIRRLLVAGGRLVFSVEHPLFTAPSRPGWRTEADGSKVWPVNQYLVEGKRVTDWLRPGIVKQHRTISSYVNGLLDQGFHLLRLEEWGPSAEQIVESPDLADEVHRPAFLLVSARI